MLDFHITEASEDAKYTQVKETIAAAIQNGQLEPLSKLPPISQIARDAGVSLRTADLALQSLINEGFCFRRPKKGTFVAAGKRFNRQSICGVLGNLDPINYPIHALLYVGIMETSIRRNVPTLTIPLPSGVKEQSSPEQIISHCDKSREFALKGVFIMNPEYFHQGIELAKAFPQKRFFLLNYEMNDFHKLPNNMAAVINDNYRGACRLAERVFGQYQPKTVSFFTHSLKACNDITYRERERGVRDAAKAAGVKVTQTILNPVSIGSAAGQMDFARETVLNFLKSKKTDFIFAANDYLALGAQKAIEELGMTQKIGIAGYDALATLPGEFFPTVKIPYTEMGKIGLAEMLNPDFRMPQVVKLQPEVIMNDNAGV